jgi:hypothetical protein
MEVVFLPDTKAWFLLSTQGRVLGGDLQGSPEEPSAVAPAIFCHMSQEYFLLAERTCDVLLNDFTVTCPSLSPPIERETIQGSLAFAMFCCFGLAMLALLGWKIPGDIVVGDGGAKTLRCGAKEELTAGVRHDRAAGSEGFGGVPKYTIRVGAEPHVLERAIVANVGGTKFPVLLELQAHRVAARQANRRPPCCWPACF